MSQPFIGPLPFPQLPAQPSFTSWCTNWGAYDVPRLWDVVRPENDKLGWEQVTGFRHLADLLVDHYRRLRSQHDRLYSAWQSPAAEVVLSRVDGYAKALLSDAHCAATTAAALDAIMATYAGAQTKMAPLAKEWDNVTTDWKPEWWDHAAEKLNSEGQDLMRHTDDAVRDHRSKIIIPRAHDWIHDPGASIDLSDADIAAVHDSLVPPIPGYRPATSIAVDAELAGIPTSIPAVPGQPVSMLPISPGSPHAPYGGAYILPGPGVGRGGYIVPMPHPSYGPGGGRGSIYAPGAGPWAGSRLGSGSMAGASGGAGFLPMTFGSPQSAGGGQGGSAGPRRSPNTVWEMEKGVQPVIEGVCDDQFILDQPSEKQEEDFKEWFAELAYPWRTERPSANQPQIILRKADS